MDNTIKSKTRLAAVQIVSQHLINKQDKDLKLLNDFSGELLHPIITNNKIITLYIYYTNVLFQANPFLYVGF